MVRYVTLKLKILKHKLNSLLTIYIDILLSMYLYLKKLCTCHIQWKKGTDVYHTINSFYYKSAYNILFVSVNTKYEVYRRQYLICTLNIKKCRIWLCEKENIIFEVLWFLKSLIINIENKCNLCRIRTIIFTLKSQSYTLVLFSCIIYHLSLNQHKIVSDESILLWYKNLLLKSCLL